jgi:hypothetical protein
MIDLFNLFLVLIFIWLFGVFFFMYEIIILTSCGVIYSLILFTFSKQYKKMKNDYKNS